MKKQSSYPLLDTLEKLGLKPTRDNYLAIDGWDNPNRKLTAEEEMELPPQFRWKDETDKPLTPKEKALLPPRVPASRADDTGRVSEVEAGELAAMPLRM